MSDASIPRVETYVEEHNGVWSLTVVCPYCGQLHHHGGGIASEPPVLGHRVTHCQDQGSGGYELVPGPPDMARPKATGRRRSTR